MNAKELAKILENHKKWLVNSEKGSRADLSGANLSRANLYGASLSGANLSGANLSGANLYGANLYGASLSGANLSRANLSGANLSGANLYGANLYGANLSRANLYGANLYGANLSRANLSRANDILFLGNEPGRGYIRLISRQKRGVKFMAGCHWLTFHQARKHWGSKEYPDLERGDSYLRLIDFAENEAKMMGWIK